MSQGAASVQALEREAQSQPDYVIGEVRKEIRRTVALYVHHATPHGPGYFEPVRLLFCWYDFIGKLYKGRGKDLDGASSFHAWLTSPHMQALNPKYKSEHKNLYHSFRNQLIHTRHSSTGWFAYGPSDPDLDGNRCHNLDRDEDDYLWLDIAALLSDQDAALERYLTALEADNGDDDKPGSRAAFDCGLTAMRSES